MNTKINQTSDESIGRLCKVREEYGYLLVWEHYAKPIGTSLFVGGEPAGQFSQVFAIVQFEDCVRRIDPTEIIFCDESILSLHVFNKQIKTAKKEG